MKEGKTPRTVPPIHHDGLGLNDLITIESDEPDALNGSGVHRYRVRHDVTGTPYAIQAGCTGPASEIVAEIQFQHGPRLSETSEAGLTSAAMFAILIDHFEAFEAGPFACPENGEIIGHLRECLRIVRERAERRAARGVLGTLKP